MRPIDADEVRKHAVEAYQANGVELEPIMMVPLSAINNAPTVELHMGRMVNGVIVPIKRPSGEWIVDKDDILKFMKCSNCGEVAEWLDGGSQFLSKFCPNCGAAMKGR